VSQLLCDRLTVITSLRFVYSLLQTPEGFGTHDQTPPSPTEQAPQECRECRSAKLQRTIGNVTLLAIAFGL